MVLMKRISLVLVLVILIIAAGFYFISKQDSTTNVSIGNVPIREAPSFTMPLKLPSGYSISVFASELGTLRDLEFSPGGTLLVSDPSRGFVYALSDDQGKVEKKIVISGRDNPHGLAIFDGKLYVAGTDKVERFGWDETGLMATFEDALFSLPQNLNHNKRTIVFSPSGKMYVSVGSTCNVCKEPSPFSASVIVSDAEGNNPTVFARGLRNAPFIQINPQSGELWATEMGRDLLGDNIPPDEINIVRQAQDYGWPYCYGNKVHDNNFDLSHSNSCANTIPPIFEIPAHSAPLGLVFINSPQFPSDWQGDLLVAYHGSWNRSKPIGYKVVHLNVEGNTITGSDDFITGFLPPGAANGPSDALGRPVDLIFDKQGNLYISDDKSGNVYIISKK